MRRDLDGLVAAGSRAMVLRVPGCYVPRDLIADIVPDKFQVRWRDLNKLKRHPRFMIQLSDCRVTIHDDRFDWDILFVDMDLKRDPRIHGGRL